MSGVPEKTICGLLRLMAIKDEEDVEVPVPLQEVEVVAHVVDFVAEVTVKQKYLNRETNPIEAVYMFPLDTNAAVSDFEATIEGRTIRGVVKEKEEARKDYEEALKKQQRAALLQQVKSEIFRVQVGNIPPGGSAQITLTYVTELAVEGSAVRFYLPTTIAPRYRPPTDRSEAAKRISEIPYSFDSPAPMKITVSCDMKTKIIEVNSPTHKITAKTAAKQSKEGMFNSSIELSSQTTDMNKDFVLLVSTEDPHEPRLVVEKSEDGSVAAMLSLIPRFELDDQKTELVFVIDRSGSMQGQSIKQAKEALKLFLRSLPSDCYLNIVGFGSTFELLFPEGSKKYDDDTLKASLLHAETLEANLGGTELLEPLRSVLEKKKLEGYLRQVFVLTDGEVCNTNQVIRMVRRCAHESRVFSLGLGSSASHELVEGISRAANGTAEFATYDEKIEPKVLKQLKNALQPALIDVNAEWGGIDLTSPLPQAEIETEKTLLGYRKVKENSGTPIVKPTVHQAPRKLPPVFDGSRMLAYLISEEGKIPKDVVISAVSPDGPLNVKVSLKENEIVAGKFVHRLAARKIIQDLEDGTSSLGDVPVENEDIKKKIIELGLKYKLASTHTAFVAIDPEAKDSKDQGSMIVTREVANQLASGWHGIGFGSPMVQYSMLRSSPGMKFGAPKMKCASFGSSTGRVGNLQFGGGRVLNSPSTQIDGSGALFGFSPPMQMDSVETDCCLSSDESLEDVGSTPEEKALAKLLTLQQFDGHFILGEMFLDILDVNVEQLKAEAKSVGVSEDSWATALAVAFMEEALQSLKSNWELVAKKSTKWLKKSVLDLKAVMGKAQQFVASRIKKL